ncbi:MAG: hypothetical protein ACLR9W_02615 [Enterobacter hormaechei]
MNIRTRRCRCRGYSRCHVNALRQINVAALVDIDSVKGLKLAMNYRAALSDYREMLL